MEAAELRMDVGRCIEEKPSRAIAAHGDGRLAPRDRTPRVRTRHTAGRAPAVPLGKAPTGGGTEENDVHGRRRGRRGRKRPRGPLSRAPQISFSPYRVATYAVTSIVTATISASGLVHFMFSSSERVVNGLTIGCYHPVGSLEDPTTPAQTQVVCQNGWSDRLLRNSRAGLSLLRQWQAELPRVGIGG